MIETVRLSRATQVSTDLHRTRRFLEDYFQFECVFHRPGRMLARDARNRASGGELGLILDIERVDVVPRQQSMFDHFGVQFADPAEVDRAYHRLQNEKEKYGISRIDEVRRQHGSYSFYCSDVDTNWWEFDHQASEWNNNSLFAGGDRFHD